MEYHEAVNRLERLRRLRPKLGTETTASLLSEVGNPHEQLTAVQVAGSNGKGSTARLLERVLREAGLDVGLYTSPDLNDLRERVQVRGQKIPKREVVRFVEETWPSIVDRSVDGDAPTFFEAFTALALWHFAREEVDVAVLEVGIGGRYDATSVVDPIAAAVTSVSLEHTDILGSTVEEIASDKAHVAPADAPLVTGATGAALETIRERTDVVTVGIDDEAAPETDAPADRRGGERPDVRVRETEMVSIAESSVSLAGPDWAVQTTTPLLGTHQALNAGVAATLARQVGATLDVGVTERAIAAGVRNVHWPGRFEVLSREPLVVLDGAHNPDACEKLATVLDRYDYDELHLVFGAMRDKDHVAMCRSLPAADRAVLAEPAVGRAQSAETLAAVFDRETAARTDQCESVLAAVDEALRTANPTDCVLVTGSLYTVSEARDRWTRTPTPVRTPSTERARSVLSRADVPARPRRECADRLVHRTIRLRVRRAEAAELNETMRSAGGWCAVSGITTADEHVAVVVSGTREQFRDLVRRLRRRSGASRHLAGQLNRALGVGSGEPSAYPWNDGTAVMGILNVTPDSFHDGGEYDAVDAAVARAEEMAAAGAAIVDVGGESTRPGADPVSVAEETERVRPVIERLDDLDAMVSVDTRKPAVADAALAAGADMVNDVTGLADAAMRRVVADHGVPAVVMHSLSAPVDPDRGYDYDDVVDDVLETLTERVLLAERAGIDRSDLLVDPGLGFGKRAPESFELLDRLDEFRALGTPVMLGHSHKSMFEHVGCGPDARLAPTVAATALAAERGVDVVRVHDVPENVAAVATAEQTTRTGPE
ncbi:dihydropteroate synthase [Salinigranum marinum]|uniref:dihydropteroate synthase n=1 Tax=Salinigranum marinum TaxID=1515595 RepID=UPI002989D686|nr:dihydropteroate synthase [Salinigranum marinum]